jgi:hypothetical protein
VFIFSTVEATVEGDSSNKNRKLSNEEITSHAITLLYFYTVQLFAYTKVATLPEYSGMVTRFLAHHLEGETIPFQDPRLEGHNYVIIMS